MEVKPYIVVGFPCFNEGQNIGPLLESFIRLNELYGNLFHTKVIVVDDGSADDTIIQAEAFLDKLDLEIIRHGVNKGLTAAINTTFVRFQQFLTLEKKPLAFGFLDGDNSHNPMHIPSMLEKINQDFDVVVASRYQQGSRISGVAFYRQVLSLGLAFLFKLLKNIPYVWDYSCGFRLYSPRIVQRLYATYGVTLATEKSFASMVELLVKCHLLGAFCCEVPFFLRYDLKLGVSKMPFLKTIKGNLRLLRALKNRPDIQG